MSDTLISICGDLGRPTSLQLSSSSLIYCFWCNFTCTDARVVKGVDLRFINLRPRGFEPNSVQNITKVA